MDLVRKYFFPPRNVRKNTQAFNLDSFEKGWGGLSPKKIFFVDSFLAGKGYILITNLLSKRGLI